MVKGFGARRRTSHDSARTGTLRKVKAPVFFFFFFFFSMVVCLGPKRKSFAATLQGLGASARTEGCLDHRPVGEGGEAVAEQTQKGASTARPTPKTEEEEDDLQGPGGGGGQTGLHGAASGYGWRLPGQLAAVGRFCDRGRGRPTALCSWCGGGASSFVRMLTCRLLQDFCLSCGALVALGQGSYLCAWRMLVEADSSIKPSWATHPPRQRILETLLPFVVVFRRLVQHHLGQAWVRFVTFQTVTHLLCELRKWLETTRMRKEGHEGRKASYLALAATFMEHHRLPETWQVISSSDGAPNQGVLKRGKQIASRFFSVSSFRHGTLTLQQVLPPL